MSEHPGQHRTPLGRDGRRRFVLLGAEPAARDATARADGRDPELERVLAAWRRLPPSVRRSLAELAQGSARAGGGRDA